MAQHGGDVGLCGGTGPVREADAMVTTHRLDRHRVGEPQTVSLSLKHWTALCAAAEAIGMTAAATAAKASQTLVGDPANRRQAALVLGIVVIGGLVEGVAVGALQACGLRRLVPTLDTRRWVLVTTAVAGIGWAAATAPAALSGTGSGAAPPLALVVGGALGLGAGMGALLGAAQAPGLRGRVSHPWRWVGSCAAAWAPAMAVIFVGASAPDSDWPLVVVAGIGTVTGLVAGAVLGLVSWPFLASLNGASVHDRVVVRLLKSPAHAALSGSVCVLRVRGRRSGRTVELPVQYAATHDGAVIVPGRPETKQWWRNLLDPAPVDALVRGEWRHGIATVLDPGDGGHHDALTLYRRRWPRARLADDALVVVARFVPASGSVSDGASERGEPVIRSLSRWQRPRR
jgi:F420H(2)-dependent quinone reductase